MYNYANFTLKMLVYDDKNDELQGKGTKWFKGSECVWKANVHNLANLASVSVNNK